MKIESIKLSEYQGKYFSVTKSHGKATMHFGDNYIDNEDYYADYMLGKCECPVSEMFEGIGTDSILICGLGMGLVPLLAETLYGKVDVLDYNKELIDYISDRNILPSSVNVIFADAYTYTPTQKYDLILVDGPGGWHHGWGRGGFFKHIDKFNTDVPMIFDDVNREEELTLLKSVSAYVKRDYFILEDDITGVIL